MGEQSKHDPTSGKHAVLSNADVADRLASLAQLLSSQKENPYKIKAYQRAAARIRDLSASLSALAKIINLSASQFVYSSP